MLSKDWHPHLIWMDMRMPILNGYEATRQIKSLSHGKDTVVIAITAAAFEDKKEEALAVGCNDFIAKPFKESEIFKLMQKHLGLEFIYEDDSLKNNSEEHQSRDLNTQMLKELSTVLKTEMKQAIEHLDLDKIKNLIGQIQKQNKELAKAIQERIDKFEYEEILSVLG